MKLPLVNIQLANFAIASKDLQVAFWYCHEELLQHWLKWFMVGKKFNLRCFELILSFELSYKPLECLTVLFLRIELGVISHCFDFLWAEGIFVFAFSIRNHNKSILLVIYWSPPTAILSGTFGIFDGQWEMSKSTRARQLSSAQYKGEARKQLTKPDQLLARC